MLKFFATLSLNYFDPTKLFSDLYLPKFLDLLEQNHTVRMDNFSHTIFPKSFS